MKLIFSAQNINIAVISDDGATAYSYEAQNIEVNADANTITKCVIELMDCVPQLAEKIAEIDRKHDDKPAADPA